VACIGGAVSAQERHVELGGSQLGLQIHDRSGIRLNSIAAGRGEICGDEFSYLDKLTNEICTELVNVVADARRSTDRGRVRVRR